MRTTRPWFDPVINRTLIPFAVLVLSATLSQGSIPTTYPTGSGITIGYSGGHVTYGYDSNGDRIPDFSKSGYMGGDAAIPDLPVTTTLNANPSGDDTARLQSAINAIAAMPVGGNGFRGVLKLNAGVYRINTSLMVTASGIVIRGAGSAASGTILRRTTSNGDAIIVQNDGSLQTEVPGTRHNITTSYVPVGATYFALDSVSGLSVGDTIMIQRGPLQSWVTNLPEPDGTRGPGNYGVKWDRTITEIDGNRIRLDAPITQAIEASWCDGYVYKYTWASRISKCGIEDLRCDAPGVNVDERGETDGNTCKFDHAINCWVRRVWNDHMRGHVVQIDGSKWITAQDITSYHNALGEHSGASIQIFTGSYSDSILYQHITARAAGFEFTAGRQHGGPIIFSESEVPTGFAASGPHMQGNAGMVWDNCQLDHGISVEYQGKGWGGFNALMYNTEIFNSSRGFSLERPNTVHLWLMGCKGNWSQGSMSAQSIEVQSHGTFKTPQSLFRAQLIDRVGSSLAGTIMGSTDIGSTDPGTGGGGGGGTEFQAEDYTSQSGCAFSSGIAGYTGTGFMDYGGNGTWVEWNDVNVASSGSYDLTFRYGNGGSTDRQCSIVVNGNAAGNVPFSTTGSWATWGSTTAFPVSLNAGNNTIRVLANTSSGGPNLDKMDLSGGSGGGSSTNEAESLVITASSGDNYTTNSESGASNGQYVQYNSNATGDYVQFRIPNVSPGAYTVTIGYKRQTSRGIVQTVVGPEGGTLGNLGSTIDMYGSSAFMSVDIGTWTIGSTGNKSVRFNVTGKNGSSSGYVVAIDYITLTLQ